MRRRTLVLTLCLSAAPLTWAGTSCHYHPPGSTPENPVRMVGSFDSISECELQRRPALGNQGYCHCSADFTPDWRSLDPGAGARHDRPLM